MNEQIILIIILIFSVIIHEVSHGLAALYQGDRTAEEAGRLTLNPIPHIDLFGSIIVPMIFIASGMNAFLAWAKPVPYNPNNLRDKKWGELIVALAGPLSNFILMFLFLILFWLFNHFGFGNEFILKILFTSAFMNLFLGIFNLVPVVPLDGSKVLFAFIPQKYYLNTRQFLEKNYLYIFLIFVFIIFNTSFLQDFSWNIFKWISNWFV